MAKLHTSRAKPVHGQLPLDCMLPNVPWNPLPIHELPRWGQARRVCIDLETWDPTLRTLGPGVRRDGYVCGIGVGIEDGPKVYIPIRHSGDNYSEAHIWQWMRDQAAQFTGKVGGANFSYDLDWLLENGVEFPKVGGFWDIQVNEPLIDDLQKTYNLQVICERHGVPGKQRESLNQALEAFGLRHEEMAKLPGRYASIYCVGDLDGPLRVARRQERIIEEQDLGQIQALENRLLPVLVAMRRRGVRVGLDRLDAFERKVHARQLEHLAAIREKTGVSLGVDDCEKKGALVMVLKAIGVNEQDIPTTPKSGQPKIDKVYLKSLKNPVADMLLEARRCGKLKSTFVEGIKRHLVKGRIHTTFNQLRMSKDDEDEEDEDGGRYGRISSTDPNLQQQPNPDKDQEFGKLWRSIYLPEEGMEWFANDYSQQEPRILIHYAEHTGCRRAREAAQRYRDDPNTDNHTLMAQLIAGQDHSWKPSKAERSAAKIIFLGLAYGMGGAKLCRSLGLPTDWKFIEKIGKTIEVAGPEGQKMLDNFHTGVPFIRELSYMCQDAVKARGAIKTLLGRRCRFPEKPVEFRKSPEDVYDWLHKAMNRLVQGSAADQTKLATCLVHEAGHFVQLQVHDELDGSCKNREEAEAIGDIMRNCIKLRVPSRVDVEVGPSWGEAA